MKIESNSITSLFIFIYLYSASASNGIEVQAKNILAEWPTQG